MLLAWLAVLLITLGLGQIISTARDLRGASLIGPNKWLGYGFGLVLLGSGALLLPSDRAVLWWTPVAGLLAIGLLLLGGALIMPPPHPDTLFSSGHQAHAGCRYVRIPDGNGTVPGYGLTPPTSGSNKAGGPAVCIVHGAGDTKTSFKWRLVQALLAEGLIVLTIDLPGHGDDRDRALTYPSVLSAVPAALRFLRQQANGGYVGLLGISLGGAVAIRSLAEYRSAEPDLADALVVMETPIQLNFTKILFYREMWRTYYRAPVLSLLSETNVQQLRTSWLSGGYRSKLTTAELFDLLKPLDNIAQLKDRPILLVYSRRDLVASPDHVQAMQAAVPDADLIESKKASHVTLTLIPEINQRVAVWLRDQLER